MSPVHSGNRGADGDGLAAMLTAASDFDFGPNVFKLELKLLMAERENIDLAVENKRLANEMRELRTHVNNQPQRVWGEANTNLQKHQDETAAAINEKKAILASLDVSLAATEEIQRHIADKEDLAVQNAQLTRELESLRIKCEDTQAKSAKQVDLTTSLNLHINRLQEEVFNLKAHNSDLTTTNSVLAKEVNSMVSNSEEMKVRIEKSNQSGRKLDEAMEQLEVDLQEACTSRDYFNERYLEVIDKRNERNAEREKEKMVKGRLRGSIKELKKEKVQLDSSLIGLKQNIGYYVTHLDLCHRGLRVFVCDHDDYSTIPDGQNSTRENNAGSIAEDIFRVCAHDDEFVQGYMGYRQDILNHHRAHERIEQGRGTKSDCILQNFLFIDSRRRVQPAYT